MLANPTGLLCNRLVVTITSSSQQHTTHLPEQLSYSNWLNCVWTLVSVGATGTLLYWHWLYPFLCCLQILEKKGDTGEMEPPVETTSEPPDSSLNSRSARAGAEGGGLSVEQPFIKLSQEEYGEHHSSIMHCRSVFNQWNKSVIYFYEWGWFVY